VSAVEIRDLHVRFSDVEVLKGIDLQIEEREVFVIMGASGGGKTTLLRAISGLQPFQQGTIQVNGIDVRSQPELARESLGMVFQYAALFDYLNVEDNILFGVRRRRKLNAHQRREIVSEMLEEVSLQGSGQLMPSELSGGMRKRVGLARALAMRPSIILYDEPTSGLDPITAYSIDQLIVDTRNHLNITSIVVSHDVTSIFRVADRIAFLNEGKLEFVGTVEEFKTAAAPEIRDLLEKANSEALRSEENIRESN